MICHSKTENYEVKFRELAHEMQLQWIFQLNLNPSRIGNYLFWNSDGILINVSVKNYWDKNHGIKSGQKIWHVANNLLLLSNPKKHRKFNCFLLEKLKYELIESNFGSFCAFISLEKPSLPVFIKF